GWSRAVVIQSAVQLWIHISTRCDRALVPACQYWTWASTFCPPCNRVSRRKSGTCAVFCSHYFAGALQRGTSQRSSLRRRHSGGNIRGDVWGARSSRVSLSLVITSARNGGTSRVFHPLRRGASECSAKGRSATRSDSQRLRERTRWDGHPAWGSALRPYLALP